jgi:Homeodomain-like domain
MSGAEAYVYLISCKRLGLAKIGVAGDARKRLRELQVGSPLELKLTLTRPYGDRRDAEAVAEELYRCFAGRRGRGSWYRLTAGEVRERLGRRATLEAPARARAAAEAAARELRLAPRRGEQLRARTEKQLAYEHRRRQERAAKQKRAAKLLGQGMTQEEAAAELGVTTRTLRNWKAAPAFRRERERQHKRAARQQTSAPSSKVKTPARQDTQNKRRARPGRSRPAARPQPDRPPAPSGQQQTIAEQTPAIDVEQAERDGPPVAAEEQADAADPPRPPSTSEHDGVPIFPDTRDGRAARLAHYEARKLNNPPTSLLDYHDAKRGLEPPAERRARERRHNGHQG